MKFNDNKNISKGLRRSAECAVLLGAAILLGLIGGAVGGLFAQSISFVSDFRTENSWLIYLLPIGGLATVAIYKLTKTEGVGTDRALESAQGEARTPILLIPAIFISSVITHLLGGSAGKEGAALQLGSGSAELVSKIIKADSKTRSILTVCGMSALFSAVFGTPIGACVFALEVAVVGSLNAAAVFPALVSSVTAHLISTAIGVAHENFLPEAVPDISLISLLKTLAIAAIVSLTSNVFCRLMHGGKKLFASTFKNPFLRIFVGGCAVIALTLIFGTDYNGGGFFVIERIFEEGTVRPEAFLLKILFTVITIGAGYKGGEIVPSFFIGATLGATLSGLFGLPMSYCAAIGMTAFFGGVTNCPIASAVIAVELFGANGFILFAAAAFATRVFSGKVSLYNKQKTA